MSFANQMISASPARGPTIKLTLLKDDNEKFDWSTDSNNMVVLLLDLSTAFDWSGILIYRLEKRVGLSDLTGFTCTCPTDIFC